MQHLFMFCCSRLTDRIRLHKTEQKLSWINIPGWNWHWLTNLDLVYIRSLNIIITASADALGPNGVAPPVSWLQSVHKHFWNI